MPKAKCPSCATVVTHAEGYDPICPNCGFAGQAPPAIPPVGYATPAVGPAAPPVGSAASAFAAPPAGQPAQGPENGMAIGALVCGIAGFFTGITAPIAVVLGIVALNQRVDGAGRGMAITGIVLGALVTIGFILFFLFIAAILGSF